MFVQFRFISCSCQNHARLLVFLFLLYFICFLFQFSRFRVSGVYACACGVYACACILHACMHLHTQSMRMHIIGCVHIPYVCARMLLPINPNSFLFVFLLFYLYAQPHFNLIFISIYICLLCFLLFCFISFMLVRVLICLNTLNMHMNMNMH